MDVDILIPAALENQITGANAGGVKAKIVAELANGPTTLDADAILYDNGVCFLLDFLCNAGGGLSRTSSKFRTPMGITGRKPRSMNCWTKR